MHETTLGNWVRAYKEKHGEAERQLVFYEHRFEWREWLERGTPLGATRYGEGKPCPGHDVSRLSHPVGQDLRSGTFLRRRRLSAS